MDILCFGEILWDTFEDGKKPGGATMNVAFHLAQQGAHACFATRVGDDTPGNKLIKFLKGAGLYSDLIQVDEKRPTCEVTVHLDARGQATYTIPQPVSWDNIKSKKTLTKTAKTADAIVLGSLVFRDANSRDTLLDMLNETKALKVFDVNLRAPHYTLSTIETLAAAADVVKMNEEEADILLNRTKGDLKEKIIEFRMKYHVKTICVTRGDKGAIVWHDHEFYEHPGYAANVVDTVGAGDAFLATFTLGLLNKLPIPQILERACAVGALVTSQRGANPQYVEGIVGLMK
jgi:fructokinase